MMVSEIMHHETQDDARTIIENKVSFRCKRIASQLLLYKNAYSVRGHVIKYYCGVMSTCRKNGISNNKNYKSQ